MVIRQTIISASLVALCGAPVLAQQFPDVQPTNWAYQAILNLRGEYGCAVGYPNLTFKPGQPATRAELAAMTNACLDNITQFYTEADARLAAALRTEFSREIAKLNTRVSSLELTAARRNQGVNNYLGAALILNQQGLDASGNSATNGVLGGTLQARYSLFNFRNASTVSVRPYVNFVSDANGRFGSAGGGLLTYDLSISRAPSGVSRSNIYAGVGYQVPFVNNSLVNFQSAVGSRGQVIGVVGAETRLTNSLVGFADVKFPTTTAANSYGVTGGSYSPVYTLGVGVKF
jgi:hypothetical protein